MKERTVGWWRPRDALIWHYFQDRVSLCERWFSPVRYLVQAFPGGLRVCKECRRKYVGGRLRGWHGARRRPEVGWVWSAVKTHRHYVCRAKPICGVERYSGRRECGMNGRATSECGECVSALGKRERVRVFDPSLAAQWADLDRAGAVREMKGGEDNGSRVFDGEVRPGKDGGRQVSNEGREG